MDVEHLWFSTRASEKDLDIPANHDGSNSIPGGENMVQTLTNMADKRLFKLVKWCKSLPLFKNILVWKRLSKNSLYIYSNFPVSDWRPNFSAHQCVVWALSIFLLLSLHRDTRSHSRIQPKETYPGGGPFTRHREMDWKDAQLLRTVAKTTDRLLWICQHESHCPSNILG